MKNKKRWLWFELADWLLTEGKRIRNNTAINYLEKHNPKHPLLKKLKKEKQEKLEE